MSQFEALPWRDSNYRQSVGGMTCSGRHVQDVRIARSIFQAIEAKAVCNSCPSAFCRKSSWLIEWTLLHVTHARISNWVNLVVVSRFDGTTRTKGL